MPLPDVLVCISYDFNKIIDKTNLLKFFQFYQSCYDSCIREKFLLYNMYLMKDADLQVCTHKTVSNNHMLYCWKLLTTKI